MKNTRSIFIYSILMGLLACAIFLITNNPQPFGKIAAIAVIVVGIAYSFVKNVTVSNVIGIVGLLGTAFIVYSGFKSHANNQEVAQNVFDVEHAVNFEEVVFSDALALSQSSNKPIFIDFYTLWCGPCIKYAKEVLSDEEVGQAMNATFINLKYNAKDGEGIAIAKKYEVYGFPTYLILDHNGNIIERIINLDKTKTLQLADKYNLSASESVK